MSESRSPALETNVTSTAGKVFMALWLDAFMRAGRCVHTRQVGCSWFWTTSLKMPKSHQYIFKGGLSDVSSMTPHRKAERLFWNHIQFMEANTTSKAEPLLTLPLMFVAYVDVSYSLLVVLPFNLSRIQLLLSDRTLSVTALFHH